MKKEVTIEFKNAQAAAPVEATIDGDFGGGGSLIIPEFNLSSSNPTWKYYLKNKLTKQEREVNFSSELVEYFYDDSKEDILKITISKNDYDSVENSLAILLKLVDYESEIVKTIMYKKQQAIMDQINIWACEGQFESETATMLLVNNSAEEYAIVSSFEYFE